MMFLQEQKMWMSNDMFKTQKNRYGTRKNYRSSSTSHVGTRMPAIVDIAKWRAQTKVIEIDQNANEVPVPPFNLVPRNYGWGNGIG
eukprot:scaffold105304_cov50-Attheya_sp.AAC.2